MEEMENGGTSHTKANGQQMEDKGEPTDVSQYQWCLNESSQG